MLRRWRCERCSTDVISVALIVQIQLQQNRTDLALKEVQAARRWAQDSLLVNIAESWVGLRVVGFLGIRAAFDLADVRFRVERNINRRSMSSKNSHRLLRRHLPSAWLVRLFPNYILIAWQRQRLPCNRPVKRMPTTLRYLQTPQYWLSFLERILRNSSRAFIPMIVGFLITLLTCP